MRLHLVFLFALLIFVSGCIGTGNVRVDKNNGLTVTEFSTEPAIAEAGDNVRFFLDVENVGGTTATCVQAELFGVDGWYDALTGAPLSFPVTVAVPQRGLAFNFFNGNFNACYFDATKGQQVCVGYVKGAGVSLSAFLGDSFLAFTNQFCNAANLYASQIDPHDASAKLLRFQQTLTPPLPERNKAGQSWVAEWILKPPILPEGLKVNYPVTARTSYFYTSNAQVNIRAFNKDEFKRRQITGDPAIANSPMVIDNVHAAPIQIVATRGDNPMIINQDINLGPVEYFSYTFELVNTGEGYPLPTSGLDVPGGLGPATESGFVFAVATINGPGAFFSNCLGQTDTEIYISSSIAQNLVKIRSDKRAPFGCQIGIDRTRWISNPVGTVSITFQIFYRYYIDREVSVRVIGPERF
ncbi:MAG: hypothetical protein HY514_02545 [Candidatus Aenigmarchaeota archaeon]|nr:hypothetical protein [Candidatus Aenigmarchaeota archaeon]